MKTTRSRKVWGLAAPLAFGAAYIVCAEVGHSLSPAGVPFATFWPASGLYVGALLLAARRRWFVAAAVVANVLSDALLHGRPVGAAFAFSLANTAEALVAAFAFASFPGRSPAEVRGLAGVLRLAAAGLAGTVTGATCGTLVVVSLLGGEPSAKSWMVWWIADMVGVLGVAPALLSWSRFGRVDSRVRPSRARLGEAGLIAVAIGAAALIGGAAIPGLPGLWLIFAYPFLVWTAVRFGARGASLTWLSVLLAAVTLALAAAEEAPHVLPIETRVIALQLAAIFIGFTVSALAAVSDEQKSARAALLAEVGHRRRVEEALRKSEERFELAAEGASDGIWDWDVATGTTYFSARFKELLGYADAEFPNTYSAWEFQVHPEDRGRVFSALRAHLDSGRRFDEVYRLRTKSGDYRWVEARGRAVRDAAGRAVRMVGSMTDVTDRRRAEERFRVLFDRSTDAHLIFDGSGIIDCNKAAVEMLGCRDKREVLSLHPAELSPEFQPDGRRSLEKCVEMDALAYEKGFHRFEWVHRRMNGEEFPVEVTLNPVELAGRPALLVVWHDISERKRHERELLAKKELLRQFIARTPAAIAILDREMRYVQVSDRWRTDYRLGEVDVVGRSHYEMFPDLPERWNEVHKRCLAGAVERCDDDVYLRADGTQDWIQWEVRPWWAADGEIGGLIFFTQVITARKRIEFELRRQARDMEAACARIEEQEAALNAQAEQLITAREREEAADGALSGVGRLLREIETEFLAAPPAVAELGAGR